MGRSERGDLGGKLSRMGPPLNPLACPREADLLFGHMGQDIGIVQTPLRH